MDALITGRKVRIPDISADKALYAYGSMSELLSRGPAKERPTQTRQILLPPQDAPLKKLRQPREGIKDLGLCFSRFEKLPDRLK